MYRLLLPLERCECAMSNNPHLLFTAVRKDGPPRFERSGQGAGADQGQPSEVESGTRLCQRGQTPPDKRDLRAQRQSQRHRQEIREQKTGEKARTQLSACAKPKSPKKAISNIFEKRYNSYTIWIVRMELASFVT